MVAQPKTILSRPRLSFWQIWNMSFGFLGIQFGFALQNANTSRIFQTLGANPEEIPILWIAAPVTGLLIQPIIGYMSDRTWGRLGRRRPYFLAGAILASLALLIMPNSPVLWVAAGTLWMMDASINVAMEPFRAFVGDMLPSEQRTAGFATQSFFIGTGAVVASMLPYVLNNYFGVSNTAPQGEVPDSVKWSFYLGGIVFLLAVVWTVVSTKEYSPEELASFEGGSSNGHASVHHTAVAPASTYLRNGAVWFVVGAAVEGLIVAMGGAKELYILGGMLIVYGVAQLIAGSLVKQGQREHGLVSVISDVYTMPKTMKQLALVQFFSWLGLFAMWIYTTAAVTSHIYGTTDATSKLYNEGADWVGVLFAAYNGFAAILAFLLPPLARATSRKAVHGISLIAGGLGLVSIYFIKDPNLLILSMVGVGLAWASILSMPYAILAGSLPPAKMGIYMGIFNFFIVIPQITAAAVLGWFVKNLFDEQAISVLVLGGVSLFAAAVLVAVVQDDDARLAPYAEGVQEARPKNFKMKP
jgi:maltose/moltooligosaccharide transporter